MTIASEIQRIKTNIENAYDALETAGATMPATENSANLASTIATISGGGETIMATNRTGSAIAVGDKVWLNKERNVNDVEAIRSNYGRWLSLISPDGNYLIMNHYTSNNQYSYITPRIYDIHDISDAHDAGAIHVDPYFSLKYFQFCYNSNGDLIAPFSSIIVGLKSSGGYWTSSYAPDSSYYVKGISHLKDDLYGITATYGTDYSRLYLCKMDSSTGSFTQTSSSFGTASSDTNFQYIVDGYFYDNKNFMSFSREPGQYYNRYWWEITNSSTLAVTSTNIGYVNGLGGECVGIKKPNGDTYVMNCNAQSSAFNVFNTTTATNPSALSRFIGQYCWASYNKKNGLLTIVQWNSLNYGIFKYEDGNFTELNYNLLDGVDTTDKVLGGFITASEDLSRFAFALGGSNSNRGSFGYNTTYTTYVAERVNSSTAWKIYKFDRQIVYDTTLTGFAETAGADGSNVSVKTLLPEELSVDLLADKQNVEFIVE